MTNYERIQIDKAFCANVIAESVGCVSDDTIVEWLDAEQRELTDEREHKEDYEDRADRC